MKVGAQLYTVREFCRTEADLAVTLSRIAEIGYQAVQLSGVCQYDPQWMKNELEKNSLRCVLTHISPNRLKSEPQTVAREHDVFNCDCVGLGSYRFKVEENGTDVSDFVTEYAPVMEALSDAGKYFMYHNHSHEFVKSDGITLLEKMAAEIPAEKLGFTLDTYWAQFAGADPAAFVSKLSGRVPCVHIKDFSYDRKMAVIGEGNINFDRFFVKAEEAGTRWLLVEQDDCNGEDPFECLRRSYNNLRAFGLK